MVEYKNEHNIVESGGGQSINDQSLREITAKLIAARDETLKAKARYDYLVASGAEPANGGANPPNREGTENSILAVLRSQYFDVSSKEADLSGKYGANNPAIVALHSQKAQLMSEIDDEIKRLKNSSGDDYEAAKLREAELKKEFDSVVARSQADRQAQVQLWDLEASARAYQDSYNTFLVRYNASLQEAASPMADTSVITHAAPHVEEDKTKTFCCRF